MKGSKRIPDETTRGKQIAETNNRFPGPGVTSIPRLTDPDGGK